MKARFCIIVDVSGSMNEMGKIHLQRNLCRYAVQLKAIDQEKYEDMEIRFYQWTLNVSEIVVQSDGDIPALIAEGSTNLNALLDFLIENMNSVGNLRILILSDGNFSNSDISIFKQKINSLPDLIIRTVAVGADADLLKLKKISLDDRVHLSENIATAIDSTIFGNNKNMAPPDSFDQIFQRKPNEQEEDWDV